MRSFFGNLQGFYYDQVDGKKRKPKRQQPQKESKAPVDFCAAWKESEVAKRVMQAVKKVATAKVKSLFITRDWPRMGKRRGSNYLFYHSKNLGERAAYFCENSKFSNILYLLFCCRHFVCNQTLLVVITNDFDIYYNKYRNRS